jgi:hypothetical protein
VKTGIGRFFQDLTKSPYRALFNPTVSGARAFNTVLLQREIDRWIDNKKKSLGKRSGPAWGVLVHGNRILAASVFKTVGPANLSQPIDDFRRTLLILGVAEKCELVLEEMVKVLDECYQGKFLAVLFKNPGMSKSVFESSIAE